MSRIYKGWIITRNTSPGHALRWSAWESGKGRLAADTLIGLKRLIREVAS